MMHTTQSSMSARVILRKSQRRRGRRRILVRFAGLYYCWLMVAKITVRSWMVMLLLCDVGKEINQPVHGVYQRVQPVRCGCIIGISQGMLLLQTSETQAKKMCMHLVGTRPNWNRNLTIKPDRREFEFWLERCTEQRRQRCDSHRSLHRVPYLGT